MLDASYSTKIINNFSFTAANSSTLQTFPRLRPSIRGLPLQRSGFYHTPVYEGFVVSQVAVGEVILRPLCLSVPFNQSYEYRSLNPGSFLILRIENIVKFITLLSLSLSLSLCLSVLLQHYFLPSFKYNQQDAKLYNILYYCQCPTCFGRFFRPSSGAQKLYTQHRVCARFACYYR